MWKRAAEAALLLFVTAVPAAAQSDPAADEPVPAPAQPSPASGFPLTSSVRRTLALMQQDWAEWLAAYEREDGVAAEAALERLRAGLDEVGMERLPELSLGAAARAVAAAREGKIDWARQGLLAAERLDVGRPETAFAAARVEAAARRPLAAVTQAARGYLRTFGMPLERTLWLANLALWAAASLLVAGAAFVVVLMATRGQRLLAAVLKLLEAQFSRPTTYVLSALLLAWPVLLPDGFFWLLLYWSVLLWSYGSRAERALLLVVWVVMAATPGLVNELRRRVAVRLSPMVRAVEDAQAGRMHGELFGDLGRLRGVLPGSAAVRQLLADQHRRLGQCEAAMPLYRQVLEAEGENGAARLDLGLCAFQRGELEEAIEDFRQAAALAPLSAAPHFNLSLVYSELYRFREAGAALARAQEIDAAVVASWIHRGGGDRAAAMDGGAGRGEEVRRELLRSWVLEDEEAELAGPWQDVLGAILAAGCLVAALCLQRLLPAARRPWRAPPRLARRPEILRRALLPGLAEAWAGHAVLAFLALLVPVALFLLLRLGALGFRLPWGYHPPGVLLPLVAGLGLLGYFLLRARRAARSL